MQRAPPVTNVLRHIDKVSRTTFTEAACPKLDGTMPQKISMIALGPLPPIHHHQQQQKKTNPSALKK